MKFRSKKPTAIYNADNWKSGDIHFQFLNGGINFGVNGIGNIPGGTVSPDPNVWYFISVSFKRGEYVKLYLNGVQLSTVALQPDSVMPVLDVARMGAWRSGGRYSRNSDAVFGAFRVWKVERDGSDS